MTDLTKLTMTGALEGLAKGEFTSVELTEAHVRAVEISISAVRRRIRVSKPLERKNHLSSTAR